MSIVTAVILQHGVADEEADDSSPRVDEINAWLAARGKGPLKDLTDAFGGSKHPQIRCWGGGYNMLADREFAEFVMSRAWEEPERLVLQITQEEGPTHTIRPAGWGYCVDAHTL